MSDINIEEIIKAAQRAPSGDNCQPFKFRWRAPVLEVYHIKSFAQHALNVNSMSSRITLGFVQEHVDLVASHQRFRVHWDYLNQWDLETGLVAKGRFAQDRDIVPEELCSWIYKRHCHRGAYYTEPLPHGFLSGFKDNAIEGISSYLGRPSHGTIAALSAFEPQMWAGPGAVKDIFSWVRWRRSTYERTGDGLYWRELGGRPLEIPGMILMSIWPTLPRLLVQWGFGALFSQVMKRNLESSSALVLICARKDSPTALEDVGRAATKIWLLASKFELAMQPLSWPSMSIWSHNSRQNDENLKGVSAKEIEDLEAQIRFDFAVAKDLSPVWMLRIGRPIRKSELSLRRKLDDAIFTED